MLWKGHFILYILIMVGLHFAKILPFNVVCFGVGALTLSLPDSDLKIYPLKHRGISHGFIPMLLIPLFFYAITIGTEYQIPATIGALLGLVIHYIGDAI